MEMIFIQSLEADNNLVGHRIGSMSEDKSKESRVKMRMEDLRRLVPHNPAKAVCSPVWLDWKY